ncbi:hypothetical protein GCM10008927_18420 [Amylibacter ulvae]|uniref:MotA/TolQ/ExbB proton channel domain-containing protein n=2 Tax=Paramylibacter ulvae TaxID=1651968 RepID=A0ABQ3D4W6_9RHOB|nr:hypothetical protein GCM10008927_18420 [Amylibacter ulvae]
MLDMSIFSWSDQFENLTKFLMDGGPSIWAIAAVSVVALAIILWKLWRLALMGAWARRGAVRSLNALREGDFDQALDNAQTRRGLRGRFTAATIQHAKDLPTDQAREATTRIAKLELAKAGRGLRGLELIANIAPLLGLLGTVLGMIAAFQALQDSGSRADPAILAGGIWEALLTTAAGMAVAIPATVALTWFESVVDNIRQDFEDIATQVFLAKPRVDAGAVMRLAAE